MGDQDMAPTDSTPYLGDIHHKELQMEHHNCKGKYDPRPVIP